MARIIKWKDKVYCCRDFWEISNGIVQTVFARLSPFHIVKLNITCSWCTWLAFAQLEVMSSVIFTQLAVTQWRAFARHPFLLLYCIGDDYTASSVLKGRRLPNNGPVTVKTSCSVSFSRRKSFPQRNTSAMLVLLHLSVIMHKFVLVRVISGCS